MNAVYKQYKKNAEFMKNRFKILVSPFGFEHGRYAIRDFGKDIKQKIQSKSPTIIDGGANRGDVTFKFLRLYHNNCTIHSFEPIPDLVDSLKSKFGKNKRVIIHNKALGSENKTIQFNVGVGDFTSSALKPTELNKFYCGEITDTRKTIDVEQVRLDSILNEDIDILKLDLQGYELEALKGCGELLNRTKLIFTEIEIIPLYENQPLFGDIDNFLKQNGFRLFNLYDIYTATDGQLTSFDALYLNTKYF